MYRIVYMGGYLAPICEMVAQFQKIQVVGVIVDQSLAKDEKDKVIQKFSRYEVPEIRPEDIEEINPDMIFVCGYTKIIFSDLLKKYLFVNIHAGILPKWRGTSANSWAIINGEDEVGYSFHRVTDVLDGGDIYYKEVITLQENEKYGDARKRLMVLLEEKLETIFVNIISGVYEPVSQEGCSYVYCSRFHKTDGEIKSWDYPVNTFTGYYRILGQPYGTGMFLFYKGKKYEILDMEADALHENAAGICGAVVLVKGDCVWIKVLDGAVKICKLRDAEGNVLGAAKLLRIGSRL